MGMGSNTETWLPVVGYGGLYEVSDQGRVRSLDHVTLRHGRQPTRWRGRVLKATPGKNGYPVATLTRNGAQERYYVHTLVLEAFKGLRPSPGIYGRHLNDVKTDNRVENLAWGTPSENNHDRVKNGGHPLANRTHCRRGHEYTPENTYTSCGYRVCKTCSKLRYQRRKARTSGNSLPGPVE